MSLARYDSSRKVDWLNRVNLIWSIVDHQEGSLGRPNLRGLRYRVVRGKNGEKWSGLS